jgi:hypothetical protein
MPEQPAPPRPGEPSRRQPPGPDMPPIKASPQQPDLERAGSSDRDPEAPMRDSAQSAGRQKKARRRWDRYDFIGAAIVAFLVALWVVHFSLPTLPPDNVPDANQPVGRN